jgi:hypothetical protein
MFNTLARQLVKQAAGLGQQQTRYNKQKTAT